MIQFAGSLAPGSDAGVSPEAKWLHEDRLHGLLSSPSVAAQSRSDVIKAVEVAAASASAEDWDGDGALPVSQTTLRYATRFLVALPQGVPSPSVLIDRDGDIVFEWGPRAQHTFSVSVARDGTLTYAGLFGHAQTHGRETLSEAIPLNILVNIERAGR